MTPGSTPSQGAGQESAAALAPVPAFRAASPQVSDGAPDQVEATSDANIDAAAEVAEEARESLIPAPESSSADAGSEDLANGAVRSVSAYRDDGLDFGGIATVVVGVTLGATLLAAAVAGMVARLRRGDWI